MSHRDDFAYMYADVLSIYKTVSYSEISNNA